MQRTPLVAAALSTALVAGGVTMVIAAKSVTATQTLTMTGRDDGSSRSATAPNGHSLPMRLGAPSALTMIGRDEGRRRADEATSAKALPFTVAAPNPITMTGKDSGGKP